MAIQAAAQAPTTTRLDVFVAPGCFSCDAARRLASEAAARCPDIVVRLIDLDGRTIPPMPLVAVPTYLLNGRIIWLGNPDPEELFTRLRAGVA